MVSAQCAYWIDDFIHLPQFHSVHQSIQLVEVILNCTVIHLVGISIGFVEQSQYRFTVTEVRWILLDIFSQLFKIGFHVNHIPRVVMLTLKSQKCKKLKYDKIINDAQKRNRILFDKLGI